MMKRRTFIQTSLIAAALLLSGCTGDPVEDMTVAEQAEIVYEGDYTEEEIEATLNDVLRAYDMEVTESNRRTVSDMAVRLAENEHFTEMDILICTREAALDNTEQSQSFRDVAAACATYL